MECQINNQKNRAFLTQHTWIALGIFGRKMDWSSGPITFQEASEITKNKNKYQGLCSNTAACHLLLLGRCVQCRKSSRTSSMLRLLLNSGGYLQLRSFTFSTVQSRTSLDDGGSQCCFRDLVSNGPVQFSAPGQYNCKRKTRVARLGWLPRQANRLLHCGLHQTPKMCHWPRIVRKPKSSPTQNWIAWGKLLATYTFTASCFSLHFHVTPCFCEWQDYHCMVAGVQLDKCATGHEMSNQESEKQSFPNTTQNWIAFARLVATYNFAASLFCTALCLSRIILDPASW